MNSLPRKIFLTSLWGCLSLTLTAQTSPSRPAEPTDVPEDAITLSPFEVSATSDDGYAANETLDGTRFRTNMKDVSAQVSIMTKDFLQDIAAVTVDDAFLYSANVENRTEFTTTSGGDYANGILNLGANRIRGLGNIGNSRDFFRTTIPGDNYNVDRISISSGPNAILFGNSNPGGVVNSAFMRASPEKASYELSVRVDNYGSKRGSIDMNQPLIPGVLGLRLAAMKSEQQYYLEPAYKDDDRFSAAVTFKPFNSTSIRGYFEDVSWDAVVSRNTRAGDRITPWIAAGSPAFDNSKKPYSLDSSILAANTRNQNVMVLNSNGSAQFLNYNGNSVNTQGPGDAYQGVDSYLYSLPYDESVLPFDANINGDGTRNQIKGRIHGFAVEQRLPAGGYFEAAYNRESFEMRAADTLRGVDTAIYADANLFLPDRVTPNPDFGRAYVETTNTPRVLARMSEFEEARAQVSYELDFTDNESWMRHLGHHRVAGMIQRSEFVDNVQQDYQARLVSSTLTSEQIMNTFLNTGGANNRFARYRYYLDDPSTAGKDGSYSFHAPFNPLTTTTMDWGNGLVYWGGVDNPYGGSNQPTITNNRIDSLVFASQSFFLQDRLVVNFGLRRDEASRATYQAQHLTANNNSGYESLLKIDIPTDFTDKNSGDTITQGLVGHVLPWMSVFYNQSSTWNQETQFTNPDDGSQIAGATGKGKDYGVMMRFFDNRLSLRLNRYDNTSGPQENVGYRNSIVAQVYNIENKLVDAADAGTIPPVPLPTYYNPLASTTYQETTLTSELESTGYEFSLTANPTRNWRLTLNGGYADAIASDIGGAWVRFIKDRASVWAQYSNVSALGSVTDTVGSRYLDIIQTLNTMAQADGQKVEQGRNYRANLVTRYSFRDGALKGAFVGGGYRWRSKPVLGYRLELVENEFPFAGSPAQVEVPALDSPIWGEALVNVDAFLGYSRKLSRRVNWRVQLNINNLFDDQDAIAQKANLAEGYVSRFYIPEPRSFVLTNTFSY